MYNQNKCKLQNKLFCCILWLRKCHKYICNEIPVCVQTNKKARNFRQNNMYIHGDVQAHVWSLNRPFCMAASSALPPGIQIHHELGTVCFISIYCSQDQFSSHHISRICWKWFPLACMHHVRQTCCLLHCKVLLMKLKKLYPK